jgi:thiazole biosynthesis protein ThiH
VKRAIYGNRIVLFAPLYLANMCMNTCTYCAFRAENKAIERTSVTEQELRDEVAALQRLGHRRLLVLTGESPSYSFDKFLHALEVVKSVKTEPAGSIRRINVEIPALSISDYERLHALDCVGTVTLFQETYHRPTYKRFHPKGPKADFDYRLQTMDRANLGGIDDVGIGSLFGLYDYRYEVLAMIQHGQHLDRTYGAGPHTISIPRLQPADGSVDAEQPPFPVSDADFRKLVAVIRCAVPYTGMILSTRESPEMRRDLLHLGVSQFSAGSRTDIGAYHKEHIHASSDGSEESASTRAGDVNAPPAPLVVGQVESEAEAARRVRRNEGKHKAGQFELQDHRTLDDVVRDLMQDGFTPSWCTACYRRGRTGEAFMKIAKKGDIQNFCHPNSLLTLREYLDDYATPETRKLGIEVIAKESENVPHAGVRRILDRKIAKVAQGERDIFF